MGLMSPSAAYYSVALNDANVDDNADYGMLNS